MAQELEIVIVSVAVVTSVDNKMTRHEERDIHAWTSKEDQEHFKKLIDQHDVLVMGSGTYELAKTSIRHKPDKLRVVLTHKPDKYRESEIKDRLEFYSATPVQIVEALEARRYKKLLIVGGGQMITDFLKDNLVDNIYLTIEPRIFGNGNLMIRPEDLDIKLELKEFKKLNDQGTVLLLYKVS